MNTLVLTCLAVALIVGMGLLLIWFGWMYRKVADVSREIDERIQEDGQVIEAEVVNHRLVIGSRGATIYFVTCRYSVPSDAITPDAPSRVLMQEVAVTGGDYERLKLGDTLTLRYLPSKPQTIRIYSGARESYSTRTWFHSAWIILSVGIGFVVMGLWVLVALPASFAPPTPHPTRIPDPRGTAIAATATRQADETELQRLQAAITPRFDGWRAVTGRTVHRVRPPETGYGRVIEIDYGYCATGEFYVYAWYKAERFDVGVVYNVFLKGYAYVEEVTPADCFPADFLESVWLRNSGALGGGWYAVSGAIEQPKATPVRR